MKYAERGNKDVEMAWLEDGAYPYYRNIVQRTGFDSNLFSRFLHKILFKYVFCCGKFCDVDFDEMGGSSVLKKAYLTFAGLEREPYHTPKKIVSITNEEYTHGIKALYPIENIMPKDKAVIIIVDKLDSYKYAEKVKAAFEKYISICKGQNMPVYCKFHPREEDTWSVFDSCVILDKNVGIESIYASLANYTDLFTIVGVKSTGLQSAKKIGFTTISLFHMCGEENRNLIDFYSRIGIKIL